MLSNKSAYIVNEAKSLIYKQYIDGIQEPSDMATYAYYHLKTNEKTNSVDKDLKFVFSDLTSEETATSFLC